VAGQLRRTGGATSKTDQMHRSGPCQGGGRFRHADLITRAASARYWSANRP